MANRKTTKRDYLEILIGFIIVVCVSWCAYHNGYDKGFDDCALIVTNIK